MKKIFTVFLIVHTLTAVAQDRNISTASRITAATVFTEGAQVTRMAIVSLSAGRNEIQFEKLSPQIDQQSIQMGTDKKVTILSVMYALDYFTEPEKNEEIRKLEVSQQQLSKQLQIKHSMLDVFDQEEDALQKNQQISGANTGVKAMDLKAMLDFQRERLTELNMLQGELNEQIDSLNEHLRKVKDQTGALQLRPRQQTGKIIAIVVAPAPLTAEFIITYVVRDAGWFPAYDVRVDDISKPMLIDFKANIQQSSGEDWKNIRLTLSNGNPAVSVVKPELQVWFLSPYATGMNDVLQGPRSGSTITNMGYAARLNQVCGSVVDGETNEGLAGASIIVKGTSIGTYTDEQGNFTLNLPADYSVLSIKYLGYQTREISNFSTPVILPLFADVMDLNEVVITTAKGIHLKADRDKLSGDELRAVTRSNQTVEMNERLHATSVSYDIKTPFTVLSNGKYFAVEIKREAVPASFIYHAVPKADANVYLTALITNWEDYHLMDGQSNIYLEGTYMGSSLFDLRHAGDTLQISLGTDKSIGIKRARMKDYSSKQLIGNYKTEERAFDITVRNNRQESIRVIVEDQVPVSTQEDIEVKEIDLNTGNVEKTTGLVKWDLMIPAKEESKLRLHYTVKYPKSMLLALE